MVQQFNKRTRLSYLAPFFILIVFVFLLIFGIKTLVYFFDNRKDETLKLNEGKIVFSQGKVKIKSWGEENYKWIKTGDEFLIGDILRTEAGAKAAIYFGFDSFARLNENTEVYFLDEENKREEKIIKIKLIKGELWIKENKAARIRAETDKFKIISSREGVFSIIDDYTKEVRALSSDLYVSITSLDGDLIKELAVRETEKVLLGSMTDNYYVIGPLDPEFREGFWYLWNKEQDGKKPEENNTDPLPKINYAINEVQDKPEIRILFPQEKTIEISEDRFQIIGIATLDTERVVVTAYTEFGEDIYPLTKYQPGEKWIYTADRKFKNLGKGENKYYIKAIRKDGVKSEEMEVILRR